MKNLLLLFLVLISMSVSAQNCNIGNESSTGFNNPIDPLFKDYLTGIKFKLNSIGTLKTLNLIGRNTGTSVKMALYKDNKGIPGDLIDSTGTATVTNGIVSLSVTPTVLNPGSYWVMAIYSTNGNHTYSKAEPNGISPDSIFYMTHPFGKTLPANAADFILYKDNTTFTYFLGIDCGITTGITDVTNSSIINFYPNPTIDLVTINTHPDLVNATYRITTSSGTLVATGQLTSETTVVDVNALQAGLYFMIFGDRPRETIKFVKQ